MLLFMNALMARCDLAAEGLCSCSSFLADQESQVFASQDFSHEAVDSMSPASRHIQRTPFLSQIERAQDGSSPESRHSATNRARRLV